MNYGLAITLLLVARVAFAAPCVIGPVVRANLPDGTMFSCNEVTEFLRKTKSFHAKPTMEKPYYCLMYDSDLKLIPFEDLEELSVGFFVGRGDILADREQMDIGRYTESKTDSELNCEGRHSSYCEYQVFMSRKNDKLRVAKWDFVKSAKNLRKLSGYCGENSDSLKHLSKLEELTMIYCHFEKPPTLKDLRNLKALRLQSYSLKSFPLEYLSELTNLEELDLTSNPIQSLPPGFFKGLTKLKSVEIRDTHLSKSEKARIKSELIEIAPRLQKAGAIKM
ncbi:MAG: leucine-rich repeat domain-containing protein [Bdellovibrionales bacterium]|nr:leucine-rich repeat domain-containing protein [Bdellovibrionales bacterium]